MAKLVAGILLAAAWTGLAGCGGGDSDKPSPALLPLVRDERAPAAYTLADPDCQQGTAPVTLTQTQVGAWSGDEVKSAKVDLVNTSTQASLVNDAVARTTYDDIYERDCDVALGDGHFCDDRSGNEKSWVNSHPPKLLRVCKDGFDYGRTSYEGVALDSAHYIQKAQTRYKQLAPGNTALAPITLSVLPEFIDYLNNFPLPDGGKVRLETWIVHNSAHFQAPTPMIALFPEAAADQAKATGFFWESQFVLGHEYGHHIDFTRNGLMLSSMGLRWVPFAHRFFDEAAFAASGSGESDRAAVHGAVGESFADLTAYYAEGGTGESLRGLPCFGFNRDPGNDSFLNGDLKALTDDRLAVILGQVSEGDKLCGAPQYRDIHIIGAIIAHALDQAFARLTAASAAFTPGERADIDQRYRMTIAWMDRYVTASRALPLRAQGAAWLGPIATALEGVTDDFLGGFSLRGGDDNAAGVKKDLCRILRASLPSMTAAPFALTGADCS